MKKVILVGVLGFILACVTLAGDKGDKKDKDDAQKELSTVVMTVTPNRPFDVVGMVYFFQGKETSIFGSDARATQRAVVKKLEDRAASLGADAIVGTQFISLASGDPGMWVFGTAVKWRP